MEDRVKELEKEVERLRREYYELSFKISDITSYLYGIAENQYMSLGVLYKSELRNRERRFENTLERAKKALKDE